VVEIGEVHATSGTGFKVILAVVATLGGLLGTALAFAVYIRRRSDLAAKVERPVLARAWFYDAAVTAFAGGPGRQAFDATASFDSTVVDGAVDGVATAVRTGSATGRRAQTGYVRNYAVGFAIGTVVLVAFFVSKAVY
jgi:NADH-quinone oxidoreductase subunit L